MKSVVPLPKCAIPMGTPVESDCASNRFMRTVLEEERRAREINAQEIQLTKENPKTKELNELTEISTELKKIKREEFLEQKRSQQIRQNNFELRQLQIYLRSAYVSKQLIDQRVSIEKDKLKQQKAQQEEDAKFEAQRICEEELLRQKELKELQLKQDFRNVLLGQMKEHRDRNEKHYAEVLKDREDMQKLQLQLQAEKDAELQQKLKVKNMLKEEMDKFMEERDRLKHDARAAKIDEYEFFAEIIRKRDEEMNRREEQKRKQRELKAVYSEKIGQNLYEIKTEQRRREDLLLDLLVEERKAKEEFRYRQSLQKQLDEKMNVRLELQRYRDHILQHKKLADKNEDEKFQQEQMKIMAERDKIEQLSDQRRRQKLNEYKRIIQEMIQAKRQQRAEEAAENLREYQYNLEQERKLQEEIAAERLRLLSAHPPEVLKYLPSGVLHEEDREKLGLSVRKTA